MSVTRSRRRQHLQWGVCLDFSRGASRLFDPLQAVKFEKSLTECIYFKGRILFGEDLKIIMDVKHVIVDLCWVLGVCRWLMIFFFFFWRVYVCFCSLQKSRYTASNCTRACEKKQKKLVHFCFINLGGYFFLSF